MDDERLLRYVEGSLPRQEAEALERALADDAALAQRVGRMRSVHAALHDARADGFGAFFVARVMNRLNADEFNAAALFYDSLRWLFARAVVVGLLAIVALGAANVAEYQELQVAASWVEEAFGLPHVDMDNALALAQP